MTTKEIIECELEELAQLFEGAGPESPWTGQEIADAIRERIKNHHYISIAKREPTQFDRL
jgi:hypothetical protein